MGKALKIYLFFMMVVCFIMSAASVVFLGKENYLLGLPTFAIAGSLLWKIMKFNMDLRSLKQF